MPATGAAAHDGRTRSAIVRLLLESGSITAAEIGHRLGISAAGVRRHLDALIDAGDAEANAAAAWQQSGRGRPAKRYRLTPAGRAKLEHTYDDLASAAMRQLREIGGEEAVRTFARRRIDSILAGVADGPDDVESTADRLADALTQGRLRDHHDEGARADAGHPDLSAPLPGFACGRGVPGAVRGRTAGHVAKCSAPTCSGWPPSSTATAPAPPTCRSHRHTPDHHTFGAQPAPKPPRSTKERRMTTHTGYQAPSRSAKRRPSPRWAITAMAGRTPTSRAPARSAACPRPWCATSRRRRASRSGCSTSASRRCAPSARSRCRTGGPTSRASTSTTSSTSCAPARSRPRRGMTCPRTSRTPMTGSASPRRRSNAWSPVSPRSTSPRSSTTRSVRIWRRRA